MVRAAKFELVFLCVRITIIAENEIGEEACKDTRDMVPLTDTILRLAGVCALVSFR